MKLLTAACLILPLVASSSHAADWPTYRADPQRSGYTSETLPAKLSLRWERKATHAPMPAWPASNRLGFDRVFQPVIAGGMLYYASSADCQIRALDAATGVERWTFFTNAPGRFAPAVWKDRVFVASDDGVLYCLGAADGKLHWSKRGGPDDRLLLGNDRLISRWPARGGPVVFEDVVYFGAGIWPSEGIYLYALDAASGKVLWCNDTSGAIFMGQPHGGANAVSGVAAQGYLVVNGDQLLVPTGRAVPAVFERATGKFKYFELQANGHKGGVATLAAGTSFINAGFTYDAATGKPGDALGAGDAAVVPEGVIASGLKELAAFHWMDKVKIDRKGEKIKYRGLDKAWSLPGVPLATALAVAGRHVLHGGDKQVRMIDRESRKTIWSAPVDGAVYGLAVARGRLYVSTDRGTLYCFDGAGEIKPQVHEPIRSKPQEDVFFARAADEILRQSGVTEGYCLDLGCGDASLAEALARRTMLHVIAIDADPHNVERARQRLQASGLYGVRVTVHLGDPHRTPYPRYFADLIVSGSSLKKGSAVVSTKEVARLQKPYGGVAIVGTLEKMTKTVRGPLDGAGSWTHQYADAANTCCSTDALVKGPLGMLWFRDSDLESPSRHGRAPAPLFLDGRLFVEGTNALRAVDAYNGRRLWEYPLPKILSAYHGEHLMGTAGTHSNLCVTEAGVFVRWGHRCLRLDAATGKKLGDFEAPKSADGKIVPWGYLAADAGRLFGTLADAQHIVKYTYGKADMTQLFTESAALFALAAETGKFQWRFDAKHSIRHNAIAIGGGRVYLIDRPLADKDRLGGPKESPHPGGELLALDAASGKVLWRVPQDVFGTVLALSSEHDVLLMCYQPTRFKLPSEVGGRLAAFRASTGERLWDRDATYTTRPLINGRTIWAQGGQWDLLTGMPRPFALKRSYGCGQIAGCTNLMVFRSATLAYYDLTNPQGVIDYGGLRPGCWINAIPAGGLVLVPDATSGCQCSYLNQAWIVLHPLE